jgi:hypothetical protein
MLKHHLLVLTRADFVILAVEMSLCRSVSETQLRNCPYKKFLEATATNVPHNLLWHKEKKRTDVTKITEIAALNARSSSSEEFTDDRA